MSMKASGSPPIYCFLLLYCFKLIAQFDKLLPARTLKTSTPKDQTVRKKKRQIQDFETHPKRFGDFEIGPKNLRPTSVFRGTVIYPYFQDRRGAASL